MTIERHVFADKILMVRMWAETHDDIRELQKLQGDLHEYTFTPLSTWINIDGREGLSLIFKPKPHETDPKHRA